jgi:transposase
MGVFMAKRRIKMRHIKKVIKLSQTTCLSIRDIEKITRLPRSTVNDYLNRFKQSGLNYEDLKQLSDSQIYSKLFKEPVKRWGKIKPDFCTIHNELRKTHVTRQLLWEEYKQQHPDGFGYTQFCYHLAEWTKKLSLSMRQIHRAGEKLFIDYSGLKGQITDPATGVIEAVDIFVCTLGASSFTYAEASADQKLASFITSHINAFEYFEGTAKVLVPDNLKSAVRKADRYDPLINESYQDMAEYYNTVVIPARPYKAQDKSKVELAVKLVQRWILAKIRNEVFYSIEALNKRIRECLEYYNHKKIRTLGKSRYELFMELDKPALQALPEKRYEFKEFKYIGVEMDYHINVAEAFYSVPYQLKGKEVQTRFNQRIVEVYYNNRRIAVHPRLTKKGQVSTLKEHMPKAHRDYADQSPKALMNQALSIGPKTAGLIKKIFEENTHPEKSYRQAFAILRAAKKHNNDKESELASAKMLSLNIQRVFHFESILKRKVWALSDDEDILFPPLKTAAENVRGSDYYH